MFEYAVTHGINCFDSAWHYIDPQKIIDWCFTKCLRESCTLVGRLYFYDDISKSGKEAA